MSDQATDPFAAALDHLDQTLGIEKDPEPADEADTPEPEEQPEPEPTQETPVEEPEAEEAGEPVAEEADPDVQAFLEKYQNDPEKALKGAIEERKLFARQQNELGELRKVVEQMNERLPEQEDPGVEINQGTIDWFDEQIYQNPQGAALWALENDQSGTLYDRAMESWYENSPRQASRFERTLEMQAFQARVDDSQAPIREQQQKQQVAEAWQILSSEIPQVNEFAAQIMEEAKESPEILQSADTVDKKVAAYRKLYKMAKGAQSDTLETARSQTEAEQKEAARAAKKSGSVTSQSQNADPESISADEKWARENLDPFLAPFMAQD